MHKEIIVFTLFVRSRAKTSLKEDDEVVDCDDEEDEEEEEEEDEEDEEERAEEEGRIMGLLNEGQVSGTSSPTFGFLSKRMRRI